MPKESNTDPVRISPNSSIRKGLERAAQPQESKKIAQNAIFEEASSEQSACNQ
jgi:hypothetical protein